MTLDEQFWAIVDRTWSPEQINALARLWKALEKELEEEGPHFLDLTDLKGS